MLSDMDVSKIRRALREEIQIELSPIRHQLKIVNRRLTQVEKDISYILRTHDDDIKGLRNRIERLEIYNGLT